jgi:hypothetical protein
VDSSTRPWLDRITKNGFVLVVPLLVWNAIFWPRLPPSAGGVQEVPFWLEAVETVLRAAVFLYPLFLSLRANGRTRRPGAVLYMAGLLIYFVSWVPWLQGVELQSVPFLVGPYATPLLVFGGIALLCRSPGYFAASAAFALVHVSGGLLKGGIL